MIIRGFFTTFLMKHSLGRFGLGNASFGLGLFFIIIDSYISNSILSYKISWCLCHRLTWLFENDHIPFKSEPLLFFQKLFLEPSATAQCYDLKFIYHSAKIINKHEHTIFFMSFCDYHTLLTFAPSTSKPTHHDQRNQD